MSFPEVIHRVTAALEGAGIAYMLTGSFASVFYGSPRSTQDIDLVIAATPGQVQTFIKSLPDGEYYADLDSALEACQRESLFNVIDLKTGWKIDMIFRKARAFSQEEFGRRRQLDLEGISLFVATAEDVILAKLEWSKLSQSQRQIEDAAGILRIHWTSLDRAYLKKWIRQLGLHSEWSDAQSRAKISDPMNLLENDLPENDLREND
jgi:hypothetical protein